MQSLIASVETAHRRKNLPVFRVGDVLRVHGRIREGGKERLQVFEGLVIAMKHGTGLSGTFTIRRIASGIGVERVFPLHSPMIAKIERLRSSKVRRAKLYFLRGRIGKKAKLKGWEAYASWSEATESSEEGSPSSSPVAEHEGILREQQSSDGDGEPEAPETLSEVEGEEKPEVAEEEAPQAETSDETEETVEEVTAPDTAESVPAEEIVQAPNGANEANEAREANEATVESADDTSKPDNGENRGGAGGETPPEEGAPDSGEKPQE